MIIWEKDIYYIYMGNYYISVELAISLYKNKTHVVETLMRDRKGNLKVVIQQKL